MYRPTNDRHLKNNSDKVALLWQGDNIEEVKITYSELHAKACLMSNVLLKHNVNKGTGKHHLYANDT